MYGFSHNVLDQFAADMKAGRASSSRDMNDKSRHIKTHKHAKAAGISQGIQLTDHEIRLILLPNTAAAIAASEWLRLYFLFHGDFSPTSEEIHLEPVNRCTIFNEYCEDMNKDGEAPLSITKFLFLWNQGFPNVKIREYKAVTG